MSANPQSGMHPEAEALNAFAEQATGVRERELILSHLAVCGRCREIVALARKAAEMEQPAEMKTPVRSAEGATPWIRNRWMAWGPALAMAGIVTAAVVMHVRRTDQGSEMAKAPQQQAMMERPAPPENALPVPAEKSKNRARSAERISQPEPGAAPSPPLSPGTVATAAFSSQPAGAKAPLNGAVPAASPNQGVTEFAARRSSQSEVSFAANEGAAFSRQEAAPQPPLRQAMAVNEAQAWAVQAAPAAKADRRPISAPAPAAAGSMPSSLYAARVMHPVALPSGLAAVSAVTSQSRVLAVDKAGTLFLSEDGGAHWQPIARQWTGRAVEVRIQPPTNLEQAPTGGRATEERAPSPVSAPVFEISNDKHQVWTSTDGKTWSPPR